MQRKTAKTKAAQLTRLDEPYVRLYNGALVLDPVPGPFLVLINRAQVERRHVPGSEATRVRVFARRTPGILAVRTSSQEI
jgi:hypothetical protein